MGLHCPAVRTSDPQTLIDVIPGWNITRLLTLEETADGYRVAFHSLHPALDRLSRYYNTLSQLDDRNAVTVDDQEKAKAV
ncbi:MAG: hypothetical protein VCE12_00385, partial [Candidatus Latescibacterota bacterium]